MVSLSEAPAARDVKPSEHTYPSDARSPGQAVVLLNATESRTQNFKRELLRRGWQVDEFSCSSWPEVFQNLRSYRRALRRSRFVLSGVGFPWQGPLLMLAQLLGRKVIIDCPMDVTIKPFPEVRHWKKMLSLFFRRADGFLTLASRDYLIEKFRVDPKKVLFVESCPDLERIGRGRQAVPRVSFPDEALLVGYSGVAAWQRIDQFAPVFKALRARIPNATWLVISDLDAPMIESLRRRAAELQILDALRFSPVIKPYEDFVATIAQCHLWVSHMDNDSLLGRHELRMELLEMGALAKPVIAVSTPALEKQGFVHDQNIILIDRHDPEASAERIAHYVQTSGELERLGANLSRHVFENFSLSQSIDRLLDFVEGPGIEGNFRLSAAR